MFTGKGWGVSREAEYNVVYAIKELFLTVGFSAAVLACGHILLSYVYSMHCLMCVWV